jgi:hypothetical protein
VAVLCGLGSCGCPRDKPAPGENKKHLSGKAGAPRPTFLLFLLDEGVGEKERLRLVFNPESRQRYLLELAVLQKAWGRTSKISFLAELEVAVEQVKNGRARLRLTLPRLLTYRPPVGREGIVHAISKWALRAEVDETGRIFSVEGSGGARSISGPWASLSGQGGGVVLPERPVGLGARWRVEGNLTLPPSEGEVRPVWVKAVTNFRLAGIQRRRGSRLASLTAESRYQVMGGEKAVLGNGKGDARLTFNTDAGRVEKMTSTVSLSLRLGGTSAESVTLKQKMRLEILAKRKGKQ